MRLRVVLSMWACALISTSAAAQDRSVASTSLCGDAYLLALAPNQASALSWQSRDVLSLAPDHKQTLPQAWDDPERLIALDPDVVVFGSGEGYKHAELIEKAGMNTVAFQWGEDFDAVRTNYQAIAERLGVSSEHQVTDLNARLEKLKERSQKRGISPTVFYIARSGGAAGDGTFVDAAIEAAGGNNISRDKGWGTVDIEKTLALEPDLIVTSYFTDGYESVQAVGIRNKVLSNYIQSRPNIDIPGALWPCAGPGLIEAAERIADALDALP